MEKEGDIASEALELTPEEEKFLGKRTKARFNIAYKLRFPVIWVLFFAIVGIVIQSIKAGSFVFLDFFGANYIQWFSDFGSFVDPTAYASAQDLFYSIMGRWYYFFYTGGLISLIWEILSLIIHSEIRLIGREKKPKPKKPEKEPQEFKTTREKIDELLFKGQRFLLEDKRNDAIEVYEEIQRIYDPKKDKDKLQHKKIMDFYNILIKRK